MRLRTACALAALAICLGCFGDDDPSGPKPPSYSGSFLIADTLDVNSCSVPAPLPATVNVTVSGTSITFAGFAGSWDPVALRGQGASAPTTVPIDPAQDCYGTYVASFDIVYANADSFSGRYDVSYTYTAGCGSPDCSYGYRIGGTRP